MAKKQAAAAAAARKQVAKGRSSGSSIPLSALTAVGLAVGAALLYNGGHWASDGAAAHHPPAPSGPPCEDEHRENCASWATSGECDRNAEYMHKSCRRSCGLCPGTARPAAKPDRRLGCTRDPNEKPAVTPGQLSSIFEAAVARFPQYSPQVHSRDPWVITFDNFFTQEEADTLFNLGAKDMARSKSVAGVDDSGQFILNQDEVRTSANSWCRSEVCGEDAVVQGVSQRIAEVTQTDPRNFELYQVLRYEPGQYYRQHSDWVDAHMQFPFGPRVYTFFLYLSDVEEGGGTSFPGLNITVTPRVGRAVWWPSVLHDQPESPDMRTMHEAQPVIRGEKRAANVWIHLHDFMTPYSKGCAP